MENDSLLSLVHQLLNNDTEAEWLEFKTNLPDPQAIGEYISALANAATLCELPRGFLLWGVKDLSQEVVGTHFNPRSVKVGNQALIPWLSQGLEPEIVFQFHPLIYQGKRLVLLIVDAARHNPVRFRKTAFIRIDSHKVELAKHPAYEQRLWSLLLRTPPDQTNAASGLNDADVLRLLNYPAYFQAMEMELPENRTQILERMQNHKLITRTQEGTWTIHSHAALLFANDLRQFDRLGRKALRIIQYASDDRTNTLRELPSHDGYASAYLNAVDQILTLLPSKEVIRGATRTNEPLLPVLAIRELLANALTHQDLTLGGTGPMVEIFRSRIEITNPGSPLVAFDRMIDAPPISRNESLASMMRQMGYCEERGSGWDKIADEIENHQLPPPTIEVANDHTRIVLFAFKPLSQLTKTDRIWAVYLHACLMYCQRKHLTNASLRQRFGIEPHNSATVSRMIADAISAKMLVPFDPSASRKMMRYVPYWVGAGN